MEYYDGAFCSPPFLFEMLQHLPDILLGKRKNIHIEEKEMHL